MEDNLRSYRRSLFQRIRYFPEDFIKTCKDNENEDQFVPLDAKTNIKLLSTEKGLYAKVVILRRKDLKLIAVNKNKNKAKFKFQGQSARSQRWVDLDFDWIEVNFSTCEPDFYQKLFQSHGGTQDTNKFSLFQFPIGNSKCAETSKLHNDAPILKYCKKSLNICCFISLASEFVSTKQIKASNDISLLIE